MVYSKERQGALAGKLLSALEKADGLAFEEPSAAVRRLLVRILAECEKAEADLRKEAERKVGTMKRNVPPGSAEWDLLIRKELMSELDRMEKFRIPFDRIG
jgi:uncharacterized protein